MSAAPHISVCVCTFRRVRLLAHLLRQLDAQATDGRFTYSIVVADNDRLQSARAITDAAAARASVPIQYCSEPRQNIALARNKAIETAHGDFVAFIDDDEIPERTWLLTLFDACQQSGADGVLGPVKPRFDGRPPAWLVKGRFYERPTYPTGHVIGWKQGRTGNVLLRARVVAAAVPPFRPEFRTGEDQDFFRRMIAKDYVFRWCNEAVAYEVIPPTRWRRTFMLRRALLEGHISRIHPTFGALDIAKTLVAVPTYAAALPFASLLGHHRFMRCLLKLCDHLGKLLGLLRIDPVPEPYVTA